MDGGALLARDLGGFAPRMPLAATRQFEPPRIAAADTSVRGCVSECVCAVAVPISSRGLGSFTMALWVQVVPRGARCAACGVVCLRNLWPAPARQFGGFRDAASRRDIARPERRTMCAWRPCRPRHRWRCHDASLRRYRGRQARALCLAAAGGRNARKLGSPCKHIGGLSPENCSIGYNVMPAGYGLVPRRLV